MVERRTTSLYLDDETAWLDMTARLAAEGRWEEIDRDHLSECLMDMANRDRREVLGRLVVLMTHLLKWEYQPDHRSNGWRASIKLQRFELRELLESGTLRNHAAAVLSRAFEKAVDQAATETGLPADTFPAACPYTVDALLDDE